MDEGTTGVTATGSEEPGPPNEAPLSSMTARNSPLASGDAWMQLTAIEPADCPKIVTLAGSPPNCAMLCWTHSSAAIASIKP